MKRSQRKVQPVRGFAPSLVPPAIDLQHSSIPTEKGVQQKTKSRNQMLEQRRIKTEQT
jgi:hypothetical protein